MHLVTSLRRPLAWAQPLPPLALVTLALLVTGLVAAGWQGSVALRDLSLSPAALAADGSGSVPYTEPQQGAGELTIPRILHQIYIGPPGCEACGCCYLLPAAAPSASTLLAFSVPCCCVTSCAFASFQANLERNPGRLRGSSHVNASCLHVHRRVAAEHRQPAA